MVDIVKDGRILSTDEVILEHSSIIPIYREITNGLREHKNRKIEDISK
jgi:hypothetical protein